MKLQLGIWLSRIENDSTLKTLFGIAQAKPDSPQARICYRAIYEHDPDALCIYEAAAYGDADFRALLARAIRKFGSPDGVSQVEAEVS
jgi:hypothetical protein